MSEKPGGGEPENEGSVDFPGRMLHQAAIYNNTEFLASLLEGDDLEHIDAQDGFGRTALYTCITNNSLECARMLLQHNADPNIPCGAQCGNMTPLHKAALNDKYQFVALLLRAGANANMQDSSGETAMDLAVKNRSEECIRIINEEKVSSGRRLSYPLHSEEMHSRPIQSMGPIRRKGAMRIPNSDIQQRRKKEIEQSFYGALAMGNLEEARKIGHFLTPADKRRIVNHIPDKGTGLLYKASEAGNLDLVMFFVKLGAEGLVNPLTVQSPLHVACQKGHNDVISFLLQNFPELAQAPTIEGSLPLHIAAAEGHTQALHNVLNYAYPDEYKQIYRETGGNRLYRLGVPINARDGRGHSALHLACLGNHVEAVKLLLDFRVPVWKKDKFFSKEDDVGGKEEGGEVNGVKDTGTRDGESPEVREATEDMYDQSEASDVVEEVAPVEIDNLDLDGSTALHLAVMGDVATGYHQVAEALLQHGAYANKPIISPSGNTTSLMEACRRGDVKMVEQLVRYRAHDSNNKVLNYAIKLDLMGVVAALLRNRAFPTTEMKVNRLSLLQEALGDAEPGCTDTFCMPFSCTPIIVNWHGLGLRRITQECLLEGALMINTAVPTEFRHMALYAITRIDISKNNLETLPKAIFSLKSLRLLNASENRLKWLPGCCQELALPSSLDGGSVDLGTVREDQEETGNADDIPLGASEDVEAADGDCWHCPWLEEICLQRNQLTTLPAALFKLPNLQRLTASHNQLTTLPFQMWLSPSLQELILSHNSLSALPGTPDILNSSASSESSSHKGSTETLSSEPTGSIPSTPQRRNSSPFPTPTPISVPNQMTLSRLEASQDRSFKESPAPHQHQWTDKILIQASAFDSDLDGVKGKRSMLTELNLSKNKFNSVPPGIPCLAPQLSKLYLAGNKLKAIGPLSNYPVSLKWLDLSHNQIVSHDPVEDERCATPERSSRTICYSPSPVKTGRSKSQGSGTPLYQRTSRSNSSSMLSLGCPSPAHGGHSICPHRAHTQLEQLRTLKLDHNNLVKLVVHFDVEEGMESTEEPKKSPTKPGTRLRHMSSDNNLSTVSYLYFPNLNVLDAGYNQLTSLPPEVSHLSHLSELKIMYNRLKDLPCELGLFRKLWNLDCSGNPVERNLQDLLGEKARKTAAVLGYLKSIKEEATLYNRMKLMFVGVQGIGKTSLLAQMRKAGRGPQPRNNKSWAQRMGHGSIKDKDQRGENISTVGVDIGDLVLCRANKEVIFRTWDFGGQREYYATHQYFLSKRSLYLVVWRVTDGEKGVNEILQWLVNIQARAPNSPVIIVGTHVDLITKKRYPPTFLSDMQRLIFEKYMCHAEPEKWGLPRVLGRIEVTSRPKLLNSGNINDLVSIVVNVAWEEHLPGSKGMRLVEQKIPATYVQLQDVVCALAEERKLDGKDPVLHTEQYRPLVMARMEEMYHTCFRDVAELNQATQFLHENGILLHYEDVNLQDIYFLDPQWLCDMLANVVTIREINSLAKCGIMHTEDLRLLFRNAAFRPEDIKTYIIDLLNKFEVALLWDECNLLIPSLLPTEEDLGRLRHFMDVRIPVRGCQSPDFKRPQYRCHGNYRVVDGPDPSRLPRPREEGKSTFYVEHRDLINGVTKCSLDQTHALIDNESEHSLPSTVCDVRTESPSSECSTKDTSGISDLADSNISESTCTDKSSHDTSGVCLRSDSILSDSGVASDSGIASDSGLDSGGFGKSTSSSSLHSGNFPKISGVHNPAMSLCRLYLMSYFPSGFWPRLITRLLGDSSVYSLVLSLYDLPDILTSNEDFMHRQGSVPEWRCWQTGAELIYLGVSIMRIKEATQPGARTFCDYEHCRLLIRPETDIEWSALNLASTSVLEIIVPSESLTVQLEVDLSNQGDHSETFNENVLVQPAPQVTASLMAKLVDHVDTLLEDWYPDLGARFVQNSRGMYLITRVVPCMRCLMQQIEFQEQVKKGPDAWSVVEISPTGENAHLSQPIYIEQSLAPPPSPGIPSLDNDESDHHGSGEFLRSESAPAESTSNAWVDSVYSGGRKVVQTVGTIYNKTAQATGILPRLERFLRPHGFLPAARAVMNKKFGLPSSGEDGQAPQDLIYCHLLEQCLHAAQLNRVVACPQHGNMGPFFVASDCGLVQAAHAAPDAVFQDIGSQYLIEPDHITRGRFLGKGSFGAVFAGTMADKQSGEPIEIAMKMLQPVPPGANASPSIQQQYQAEKNRWDKEPMKNACEAYLNARKELSILLTLQHPHIVPLLGISLQPLCLVLSLAPQGALYDKLTEFRRAGDTLPLGAIQQIIMQVAGALAYLHCCQIIYRDLKSENVLVWYMPQPHDEDPFQDVLVKLADYGVSRAVLPSGAKGFAGTPPFIAPEIIQHNGEEAYTEKVDIFSFGMFMYELLVLKLPFEDGNSGVAMANLKGHILAGGRPPLTQKELAYPSYVLDLMTLCWATDPTDRPSAKDIRTVASQPPFCHLQDIVPLDSRQGVSENTPETLEVLCACSAPCMYQAMFMADMGEQLDIDVWVANRAKVEGQVQGRLQTFTFSDLNCTTVKTLEMDEGVYAVCMVLAGSSMWLADQSATIHVYSLDDYSPILRFPASTRPGVHIVAMVYSPQEHRVYVVLDTGRLVLCDSRFPADLSTAYTPVKTECPCNNRRIHAIGLLPRSGTFPILVRRHLHIDQIMEVQLSCYLVLLSSDSKTRSCELWCGQDEGKVSIWNLCNTRGSLKTVIHEAEVKNDVTTIVAQGNDDTYIWTYMKNGAYVYLWDSRTRKNLAKLDMMNALAIDSFLMCANSLSGEPCTLVSMCVCRGYIYIGTSTGKLIVAKSDTMDIITIVDCHSNCVQTVLPLVTAEDSSANQNYGHSPPVGLATLGVGYCDMIGQNLKTYQDRRKSSAYSKFLFTWHGDHWQPSSKVE